MTIAECDLVLSSARAQAALITDRFRDATILSHTKGNRSILKTLRTTFRHCKDYDRLHAFYTRKRNKQTEIEQKLKAKELSKAFWDPLARNEAEAVRAATPDLLRFERYMRRAWSRRRKALRAFVLRLKELEQERPIGGQPDTILA